MTATRLAVAAALLAISAARAGDYLRLEKTYHTKCIGLYETVVPDGRAVYHTQGLPKDNVFTKLDVPGGECAKAGSLPSFEFLPRAASADYLFAMDGVYNRHSVYRKSDWKRTGTLRLKDNVTASAIEGDTLVLLQRGQDRRNTLTRFALPQMALRDSKTLDLDGDRVLAFGHSFLFTDPGKIAVYDVETGAVRQTSFPVALHGIELMPGGLSAEIGCGSDARLVGDDAVMVHTTCHDYAVFDLATLKPRYEIALGDKAVFAKAFVSGALLYVFAEITTTKNHLGGVHDDVRVVDFQTGHPVASLPPFVSGNDTYAFQVEDRLVWAVYDPGAQDFRVDVYRMQAQP